jgi:hypothetical protein
VADELGLPAIVVLLALGLVTNVVLYAPRMFGLFAKDPLSRALADVAGPGAGFGSIALPLRRSLSIEGVALPDLPDITEVRAEVNLFGLRRDLVTIPRIVLTRAHSSGGSPEAEVVERAASAVETDGSTSDRKSYDVGTIIIRSEGSEGGGTGDRSTEITADGPGRPVDLHGLVRHVLRVAREHPRDESAGA